MNVAAPLHRSGQDWAECLAFGMGPPPGHRPSVAWAVAVDTNENAIINATPLPFFCRATSLDAMFAITRTWDLDWGAPVLGRSTRTLGTPMRRAFNLDVLV